MKNLISKFLVILLFFSYCFCSEGLLLFWWRSSPENFGDKLSQVVIERLLNRRIDYSDQLKEKKPILLGIGSILHYARDGDVIWGAGFRENPLGENRFKNIDVRAVRGPLTRRFLLEMGIKCPEVYGDPALLIPYLFPEFKKSKYPSNRYIIIPHRQEIKYFSEYKNVVLPTEPWDQIINKILNSKLVISSSLHGIIVAEAFGVPARLLKMSWMFEPLLKYKDYYLSTGRPNFKYAESLRQALRMEGVLGRYIFV
jgi:pyruvyltransferase